MDILAKARQQSISNGCFTRHEKLSALVGMLSNRVQGFLVIDALDEALDHEHAKVLGALRKLCSCTNFSILVSTRVLLDDEDIEHAVVSIDRVEDNTDIRTALEIEFSDGGRLSGVAQAEIVRSKLALGADGNMRWLTLIIEQLRAYANIPHKFQQLLERLPSSLEGLYTARLSTIPSDDVGDIRRLFTWILYSESLHTISSVEQLALVLAFDYSQPMPEYKPSWLSARPGAAVTKLMDSMFITMNRWGIVHIAHASVRDFLVSLPPSSPFYISSADAICLMARTSLAYLLAVVKKVTPIGRHEDLLDVWHRCISGDKTNYYITLKEDIFNVLENVQAIDGSKDILKDALGNAVIDGHEELVLLLLNCTAEASSVPDYDTLLRLAASCNQEAIVGILLDKGAQIEASDSNGMTALHLAAREGHLGIACMLIGRGASISAGIDTPLIAAVCHGQEDILRLLLDQGAYIEDRDKQGWTSLHCAALKSYLSIACLLLERGASITARTKWGAETPLLIAAEHGREDIVRLFLNKGADIEDCNEDGCTSLHLAARRGHLSTVNLLLDRGARIAARNKQQDTPLIIAAFLGREDVVRLLLDKGADIEDCNEDGCTSLHLAARRGHCSTVNLLLERGANVSALNNKHRTPLHHAVVQGYIDIIRLLIDRGAALETRDEDGWTALSLAVYCGQESVIELLLDLGSDPRTRADDGTTLLGRNIWLWYEAERHARIREMLLRAGCTEETERVQLDNGVQPEDTREGAESS